MDLKTMTRDELEEHATKVAATLDRANKYGAEADRTIASLTTERDSARHICSELKTERDRFEETIRQTVIAQCARLGTVTRDKSPDENSDRWLSLISVTDAEFALDQFIDLINEALASRHRKGPKKPPEKGDRNGECNRTACANLDARWFNHSTRAFYCGTCATKINEANREEAQELYGHALCTKTGAKV